MVQASLFAFYFLTPRFHRSAPIRFLAAAFLVMATIKADQIYQMLGGLERAPEFGFLLSPFQWLMTPLLYLYVRAKTTSAKALAWQDAVHLIPFFLTTIYYSASFFVLGVAEKQQLLAGGWLATPINRFVIPLLGDGTQIAYLAAALRLMNRYGLNLKDWFSSVEKRELRWLKRILIIWIGVFIVHLLYVVLPLIGGWPHLSLIGLDMLNIVHFLMVNVMALAAITDYFEMPYYDDCLPSLPKNYKSSTLAVEERQALFSRLEHMMSTSHPYLDGDLTLKSLAHMLACTPRELSETINAQANRNFFDYINSHRVKAAKQMLVQNKATRVIDVANASGFNSKSVFNQAFKRHVGQTPTSFRARHTTKN